MENPTNHIPIRVLVVGPYPLTRFALSMVIREEPGFELVRELSTFHGVSRSIRADVIVGYFPDGEVPSAEIPVVAVDLDDGPHRIRAAVRRAIGAPVAVETNAVAPLTARELEVTALVASGYTDQQIADALYLSVRTVRSHLDRIRAKTGLRRRAELTRWYLRAERTEST